MKLKLFIKILLLSLSSQLFAGEYIICTDKYHCTDIDNMIKYNSVEEALDVVHRVCNVVNGNNIDNYEQCLQDYFIEHTLYANIEFNTTALKLWNKQ